MVGIETILSELPPYQKKYAHISENQNVYDIIKAIKNCHKDFAADYDKIAKYFVGQTPYKTCKNIFDFLRANTDYVIETEDEQTVKSPAAILESGQIDCKGFALFSCGVLDAINRMGLQNIPFCYRFVSDSIFNITPNHVFCVAYPETKGEIFIDPIPQVESFNEPINYYYSQDKKFKAMSLYKVSGIDNKIGFTVPVVGVSTDDLAKAVSIISSFFPGHADWWKFDQAYNAGNWPVVASYIKLWGQNAPNGWNGNDLRDNNVDIAEFKGQPRTLAIPKVYANTNDPAILDIWKKYAAVGVLPAPKTDNPITNIFSSNTNPANSTSKAGMNILVTLALVGAGIYFLTKKKR